MRLLDLFCGAGGCAVGYHRAGFDEIVGVDIEWQPRYPFKFICADAMEYLANVKRGDYDMIHASPPCQGYSITRSTSGREFGGLVPEVRNLLALTETPYVIENVVGCPFTDGVLLCGTMFGLQVYRHRIFETSVFMMAPSCKGRHFAKLARQGYPPMPGEFMTITGSFSDVAQGRIAMGIDWMTRDELSQAIPPDYTQWIGERMVRQIQEEQ